MVYLDRSRGERDTWTGAYDDNGNRIGAGHVTDVPNRLVDDGRYLYEYDNEGNLLVREDTQSDKVLTFAWDYRNRLAQFQLTDDGAARGWWRIRR